jgi:RNA polymerase-interacting CarD/CdnL/TRCF family regulator
MANEQAEKQTLNLKVGDKIVHFGQIYRIFRAKRKKGIKEEQLRILKFRPYFKNKKNKSLVFSIPEKSLEKTNIRKPLSKKEINKLLKKLTVQFKSKDIPDAGKLREKLVLNDPAKLVRVLRQLWRDKKNEETNFTKSKENVFKLALKKLSQEVALVKNIKLDKAKEKIQKQLKKSS